MQELRKRLNNHYFEPECADAVAEVMNFDVMEHLEKSMKEVTDLNLLRSAAQSNKHKEKSLRTFRDTTFSMKLVEYIEIIEEIGFVKVFERDFIYDSFGESRWEKEYVYKIPNLGAILHFCSYGDRINGGKVYYNWRPNPGTTTEDWYRGGLTNGTWCGHVIGGVYAGEYDCREGLVLNLYRLSQIGYFPSHWFGRPHLRLMDYAEVNHISEIHKSMKQYDAFNEATERKIAMLPKDVQEVIGTVDVRRLRAA